MKTGLRADARHGLTLAAHGVEATTYDARISDAAASKASAEAIAVPDGVGDGKTPVLPDLLVTVDDKPDDITGAPLLTVDGEHVVSTIDTIGDRDFFAVDLEAGQNYDISMFLKLLGPSGTPLPDSYIELYDSEGNLLVSADGGGTNTPEGLDAVLSFKADISGRYYINCQAFDQDATNGTTGDGVGDYEVFVSRTTDNPYAYKPYYDIDSPLHSIDWGTQIDRTSRNPDGDQGPRDNGEAYTGVGNSYGITGKNVVTYYLAKTGDVFVAEDPTNPGTTESQVAAHTWLDWETASIATAFKQYENVADLKYIQVDDRYAADFKIIAYEGTPGPGASLLGRMSPPGTANEGQVEFNAGDERWTKAGLTQGGFFFTTFLHEFGHGHGMAHPHDNGGHSSVMRGAGGGTAGIGGGLGDFDLSQQIYTVMSYNDGWQTSPYGQASDAAAYGWVGSLTALDIAVIQDKYGVNEDFHDKNDVYKLKDVNKAGTFYQCIWDAGGKDSIVYNGERDAMIDLRDATLKYEYGGGGWMSYADGVFGGYTIANGAIIENARGGAGNDTLIGNEQNNRLNGGAGNDILNGFTGHDMIKGGEGMDRFVFDQMNDKIAIIEDLAGKERIDLSGLDADINTDGDQAFHLVSAFTGAAGEAVLSYKAAKDLTYLQLDVDGDGHADMTIAMSGDHEGHTRFIL